MRVSEGLGNSEVAVALRRVEQIEGLSTTVFCASRMR